MVTILEELCQILVIKWALSQSFEQINQTGIVTWQLKGSYSEGLPLFKWVPDLRDGHPVAEEKVRKKNIVDIVII